MAKSCKLARRVAISPSNEARLVFDRGAIVVRRLKVFGPFLFNHLDYICYLYHKSFSMSIHRSGLPYDCCEVDLHCLTIAHTDVITELPRQPDAKIRCGWHVARAHEVKSGAEHGVTSSVSGSAYKFIGYLWSRFILTTPIISSSTYLNNKAANMSPTATSNGYTNTKSAVSKNGTAAVNPRLSSAEVIHFEHEYGAHKWVSSFRRGHSGQMPSRTLSNILLHQS